MSFREVGQGVRAEMAVRVGAVGQTTVVWVTGDLDMTTTGGLRKAIDKVLENGPETVVVDLDGVTFLGSDGISLLLSCQNAASPRTRFCVVTATAVSLRPLQLTGITGVLPVFATHEAALAAS